MDTLSHVVDRGLDFLPFADYEREDGDNDLEQAGCCERAVIGALQAIEDERMEGGFIARRQQIRVGGATVRMFRCRFFQRVSIRGIEMNKTILAAVIAAVATANVYAQTPPAKSPAKSPAKATSASPKVSGVRGADAGKVSGVRGADAGKKVSGVRGADAKAGPAGSGGVPKGKLPH